MIVNKKYLIVFITICLCLITHSAHAAPGASIMFNEAAVSGGYWKYDFTFRNTSSEEYLYGVRLEFSGLTDVISPVLGGSWEGMWGNLSPALFLEAHSSNRAFDIASGNTVTGFSITSSSQIGDTAFTAFFDDHNGNRSYTTGATAMNTSPVAPEPVSTVLFLSGGAIMAIRFRLKRKIQLA